MRRLRLLSAVLLLVMLGSALLACGPGAYTCEDEWGCVVFEPGQSVKLAYVGPMTGDNADFGLDISRGVELAIKDHPTVQGFTVELVVTDTQGTPELGAVVAGRLVSDTRVVGIVGHTFSGSTEAAIPIYERAHIVMVSPSATNPQLTKKGSAVFNRVAFHDELQGKFAANYIYNVLGVRRIAVIHDGEAYGQGLAEMTASFFEDLGGTVVGTEVIESGQGDHAAALAAAAALNPELIYFGGYDADAAALVSQKEAAGMAGVTFFGCDGSYGTNYLKLAGPAAEGSFSTYVPIPESAAFDRFQAEYKANYGDEQGKLSPFSPHGYDATMLILNALDRVAIKHGRQLVVPRKALAETVRGTSRYQGLTGMITCSEIGECAAASIAFMQVQDGQWVRGPEE